MQENNYNLGVRLDEGEMFAAGIAYVIIPSDVTREQYIRECYKTKTVSIYSEFNGYSNRVPIDVFSLSMVKFPQEKKQYGSAVSFIVNPIENRPIITAIFYKADEVADLKENQFKLKRELNGNTVEIVGSPEDKFLSLNVASDTGGEISINLRSNNDTGRLSLDVDGQIEINASGGTVLSQYDHLTVRTASKGDETKFSSFRQTDEENNLKAEKTNIDTEELRINGGDEPFVLGEKIKEYLKGALTEISNALVSTPMGLMPLTNKAKILEYATDNKLDEFLSEVGFIDR